MAIKFPLLAVLVLISALLFLSCPQGSGRRIRVMRDHETWNSPVPSDYKESVVGREMMEMVMDYPQPGANTNPRTGGGIFNSPPPYH